MKYPAKFLMIVFPVLIAVSCIVPYEPEELRNLDDIIVVEGNISITGPFTIKITRSAPISTFSSGQRAIKYERNARVYVRDDKGQVFRPETITAEGEYRFDFSGQGPDPQLEYQLVIESQDGNTYESDLRKARHSSNMDLHYFVDTLAQQITIYLDAYDITGQSTHYNWKFTETWDYVSQLAAYSYFDVFEVKSTTNHRPWMHRCWNTRESSEILLVETSSLSEDRITDLVIQTISFRDIRITQHYAIEVTQTVLDSDAYRYLENMRKNSNDIGDIFSPQPNEINGNIRCTTDPEVRAIGFVSVCNSVRKRLFIDCTGLPGYVREPMPEDTLMPLDATVHSLIQLKEMGYSPHMIDSQMGVSHWNLTRCIDCRSKGGIPQVPVFWPVEWPWF
ncbi:MAG: DUF4249 domain-containing protein [Bacteroidales bacterium]|jgi:hypothetical protein|nr:DUF4249 domain-containing protein [Bacteroidales bacterium]MDD2824388.1 DUF4249 domain-containing protein [Bacteroidales bacterium]MDD3100397.1 DUF4249 domain-containing protein [Bacteroidales bacterium]MDD3639182.1 DUF4249 domain-containing protein [Bacteroidales bacterium]MDD3943845.1 DUF4249 domain-containing protein [Bacteroidales bacterium]